MKSVPQDIRELQRLVNTGKLFAVQDWIKEGRAVKPPAPGGRSKSVLVTAAETGFHSMVEVLLRVGGWTAKELGQALEVARSLKHFEVAAILATQGAAPITLDFEESCENLDLFMMERHLRDGIDPNQGNVFASVLISKKARPLLGFYRQFRSEFPALDDQAALALSYAVQYRQLRWIALLVWAGADPFRPVPWDSNGSFPVAGEDATTAAHRAMWIPDNKETLKALKLTPSPTQAIELLSVTHTPNVQIFRTFLAALPASQINDTPRGSSTMLERWVSRSEQRSFFGNVADPNVNDEALRCLELLLDSGAHWNPPPDELRYIRRNLLSHHPRYVVQILRLLLYTPKAANLPSLLELCRSNTLLARIEQVDKPLIEEIRSLRKVSGKPNDADVSTSTEI